MEAPGEARLLRAASQLMQCVVCIRMSVCARHAGDTEARCSRVTPLPIQRPVLATLSHTRTGGQPSAAAYAVSTNGANSSAGRAPGWQAAIQLVQHNSKQQREAEAMPDALGLSEGSLLSSETPSIIAQHRCVLWGRPRAGAAALPPPPAWRGVCCCREHQC
jgi:hypothetical protein